MFKRITTTFFLGIFVLPMFVLFCSHDFKHTAHEFYESNYPLKDHNHTDHIHSEQETEPQHHPIDYILMSYLEDYLHNRQLKIDNLGKNAFKNLFNGLVTISNESFIKIIDPVKQLEPGILSRNDIYLKTMRLRIDV